jgi:APA family basic amino acid/polyamine antiporter
MASSESGAGDVTGGLRPTLGVAGLAMFGVGNMLGAGIYGLVGKAAGVMGSAVWLSFLASVVAAGCTGLTYASLGSRFPRAGGAAYIVRRTFGRALPAYIIGLTVAMSGLVSMAAGSHVFASYFVRLAPDIPAPAVIAVYVLALAAINAFGMRQSSWLNMMCTVVEAAGLLLVIAVGLRYWGSVDYFDATTASNPGGAISPALVLSGAALTFYAFIGFEDVLNVAEEVNNPRRTIPIALIIALTVTMLIYIAVAVSAVSVVPAPELAAAEGPLAHVVQRAAPGIWPALLPVIALFAVANTGLLNYIMSSRMAYGMARDGLLPSIIGRLHPTRRTPQVAIVLLGAIVLGLAAPFTLTALAQVTSLLLLTSFIVMNACMIVLKRRPAEPRGAFEVPTVVPLAGIVVSAVVIASAQQRALLLAAILLACITAASLAILLLVRPAPARKAA